MTVHQLSPTDRSVSPAEAFDAVIDAIAPIARRVVVDLGLAAGRVAALAVRSERPRPPFDQSAVDGYGVGREALLEGAVAPLQLVGGLAAGDRTRSHLRSGETIKLATGAIVPPGVVAVAMREHCRMVSEGIVLDRSLALGANIRRCGEDVAAGSILVDANTLLDARHIALLAASGVAEVVAVDVLRVGLVSTGNELREQDEQPAEHEIYDANRPMLKAMLRAPWMRLIDGGIVRDDTPALADVLGRLAATADAIVMSGGAMGSDSDHTAAAIVATGGIARPLRIAQRPGKPIVIGAIDGTPLIGLPGNTSAAMVNCMLYALPMLMARAGLQPVRPAGQPAVAHSRFEHTAARTGFVPARIVGRIADGRPVVEQLSRGGSARLRPFVEADGIAELSAEADEIQPGTPLTFHPFHNQFTT